MAEANWHRHALSVARTEFRRTVRAIRADTARAVLLGIGILGSGFVALVMGALLAVLLRERGLSVSVSDGVAGSVALFWLFGAFIVAQRTMNQHDHVAAEELLLTTVSPRTVAAGMVLAEMLRAFTYLLFPVVSLTGVVAVGFDSPVSLLVVPLTALCMLATTVLVGSLVGYVGALLIARSRFVARYKAVIGVLTVVVVMGPYVVLQTDLVDGVGPELLAGLPVAWFAHLAAMGTGVEADPLRAVGSLLTTALVVGPGGVLLVRLAEAYWYTDPVAPDTSAPSPAASTTRTGVAGTVASQATGVVPAERDTLGRALGRFDLPAWVGRPSHTVARKAVVRTRRNPRRLSFVLLPILIASIQVVSAAQTAESLSFLPPVAVLAGAWTTGAAFGLNPLGDEGNVLPATITSGVSARAFVTGVAYPGALVGIPFTIVVVLGSGVVAGTGALELAGLVGLGLALAVFALALAPALGMRFPRFSALRAGRSREVIPPTLTTAAVYSIPLVLVGVVGIVGLLLADLVAGGVEFLVGVTIPSVAIVAVCYGGAVTVCILGAWLAYWDACATFRTYRVA
jgi:ABC-2 type transport system permease protein